MKGRKIFGIFTVLLLTILIFAPGTLSKSDDILSKKVVTLDEEQIIQDFSKFFNGIKKDNSYLIKKTIIHNLSISNRQFKSKEFTSIENFNKNLLEQIERKCSNYLTDPVISNNLIQSNAKTINSNGVENHVEIIFPWITMFPPCYGIAFEVWLDHDTAILVTSGGGISSIFISLCGPIGIILGALVASQSIILSASIGPNGVHFLGVFPIVGIPAFPYIDWAEPL